MCDAAGQGADGFHFLGLAQLVFKLPFLGPDAHVILFHLPLSQHVLHADDQFVGFEGFSQIITGPFADGLDGRIDGGFSGDNDEGGVAALPVNGVEQFKAGHLRHHDIQEDKVGGLGMDEGQGMAGAVGDLNLVVAVV